MEKRQRAGDPGRALSITGGRPHADDEASADLLSSTHHHLIRRIRAISRGMGETDGDIDDTPLDHLRDLTFEGIREVGGCW
jgi:hypothetical protein